MVSKVSGHGQLAPLLWTCDEAEYHGGEGTIEQSCSSHGGLEAEGERREEWVGDKIYPSRACPQ